MPPPPLIGLTTMSDAEFLSILTDKIIRAFETPTVSQSPTRLSPLGLTGYQTSEHIFLPPSFDSYATVMTSQSHSQLPQEERALDGGGAYVEIIRRRSW